ncbi:outer membrane lipoprotein carrier protein LolA [Thalassotalea piscium]
MRTVTLIVSLFVTCLLNAAENNEMPNTLLSATQALSILSLETNNNLNGNFLQKKYFKILKKPFISSGKFSSVDQKFTWRTLTPVQSAIIFRENKLYIENANGELSEQDEAQDIGHILQQLLSGQFESLSDHFLITRTAGIESEHCLMLIPKDKTFAQVFKQIALCGQGQIDKITLFDPQTNYTVITLSYTDANDQSNAERHYSH